MFIFNFKVNNKLVSKIFMFIAIITILSILFFSFYLIFFKGTKKEASNCVIDDNIFELNETNYTNTLKASYENIDDYVGLKVKITGYVYRLLDFKENEFVIARDMQFGNTSQTLVVGFLCNYDKAKDLEDGKWFSITGEIQRGYFNGEIAILKVISVEEAEKPENLLVAPPDLTYIPTANMF